MPTSSPARPLPLPSLHALQVFDAAAQHLSFTAAAKELNVTQTAISHQIRSLEAELGVVLFKRLPRRLTLTPLGEAWAGELRVLFARLQALNQRLRERPRSERPVVALSTLPSFGSRWLVPRLGRFLDQQERQTRATRIDSSRELFSFGRAARCALQEPLALASVLSQGRGSLELGLGLLKAAEPG